MDRTHRMDRKTARRILATVPHARRFPVGHLKPPLGLVPSFVRSIGELEVVMLPQADSLPGIHLERLAAWIEKDVGDPTGAAQVRAAAAAARSYVEACQTIYERIRDRLESARWVIASTLHEQAPERRPR